MFAVHCLQNAISARLNRQMQEWHQLFDVPVRRNQIIIHIARMGCGVTNAIKPINFGQLTQQTSKPPFTPIRRVAVIGVHILAKQGQFTRAMRNKLAGFVDHIHGRA